MSFGKKDEIYGSKTLYREFGNYIARLELYENSLKYYDDAVKKNSDDTRALIKRSKARAKSGHYKESLEDINEALKVNKSDPTVLAEKALNTYLNSEFENGLVQNTRMLTIRKKPECFYLGTMHCTTAIDNAVGDNSGKPLRDHLFIIRKLAWEKMLKIENKDKKLRRKKIKPFFIDETGEKYKHVTNLKPSQVSMKKSSHLQIRDSIQSKNLEELYIPPSKEKFCFRPAQRYTTNIENFMAEKYLDTMYEEKNFVKNIQQHHGFHSPNENGNNKMNDLARKSHKQVSYIQECLRYRRPFYSIKNQQAISKGALKRRQQEELYTKQQTTLKEADMLLQKLNQAFEHQQLVKLLELAERLRTFCDVKPKKFLPNKEFYVKEMIQKVRKGYYRLNRISHNQYEWDQKKRAQVSLGIPISREPSTDSVIGQMRNPLVDFKKQIKKFERRLTTAEDPEEICWYYYELCKNHTELKEWEVAGIYGKKCIQAASESPEWVVIANMLLARISVSERNKLDAKNIILLNKLMAKELEDATLNEFLDKCLEVVEEIEFDDLFGPKSIATRERNIVALLENPLLKNEFTMLFSQMAAQPSSRRMNIVPGIQFSTEKPSKT